MTVKGVQVARAVLCPFGKVYASKVQRRQGSDVIVMSYGEEQENMHVTAPLDSLAPRRYRFLSGSALKVLAMVSMLVDHTSKRVLVLFPVFKKVLFSIGGHRVSWAVLGVTFGRLAFPIFAFLLVEGFVHTRDRFRYGRNLLLFAFLSEVPFDLCRKLTPWDPTYQNVFFTLFISYLALCAYESYQDQPVKRAFCVLGLALVSMGLLCDYGPRGFALILTFYLMRSNALAYTAIGSCILTATWRSALAFIPINLYDGSRGFIRGPILKYTFYLLYPAHLLLLWWLQLRFGVQVTP